MTREVLEDGMSYGPDDLHRMGSVGRVIKHKEHDNGAVQVFVQVMARFRWQSVAGQKPVIRVSGEAIKPQFDPEDPHVRALVMGIVSSLKQLIAYNPVFEDEIKLVLANFNNIDGPGRLTDLAASLTTAKREDIQAVLETVDIETRMEKVLMLLAKETELAQLKNKITDQINEQISDNQRKFFLHEQLKAIKEELGLETDEKSLELGKLQQAFAEKKDQMSAEAVETVQSEIDKLTVLDPSAAEYGVARNRLEWIIDLPWGTLSDDNLDLSELRQGLDRDHYGLEDIKERIVEFCAVRHLKEDRGGGIIALVGPLVQEKHLLACRLPNN